MKIVCPQTFYFSSEDQSNASARVRNRSSVNRSSPSQQNRRRMKKHRRQSLGWGGGGGINEGGRAENLTIYP